MLYRESFKREYDDEQKYFMDELESYEDETASEYAESWDNPDEDEEDCKYQKDKEFEQDVQSRKLVRDNEAKVCSAAERWTSRILIAL